VHRGFVKAHVAVDVEMLDIAAVMVTDDRGYDAHFLVPLVRQAQRRLDIVRVLVDAAYDTRENFEFLRNEGIEVGIRIRRNANARSLGRSLARPLAVRELHGLGEEEWMRHYGYGLRWKAETAFSAVKRVLGESLARRATT
jgi:hypothetical protein